VNPGDVVAGRFELQRLAGAGGMGEVWRAVDQLSGEPVALKLILHPSPEQVTRFLREARLLAELDHPAIACHLEHGVTDGGRAYLAMEWLDGEDLATRLERGPLGVDASLALLGRVAEAMAAVHARGVVHRDLKPGNLFLQDGAIDRVKVLDFGIARRLDATYGLTDPGAPIGTPSYMAPEQVRGEDEIDARADIYSLGCVLFECLAGRPPFVAAHPLAVLAKILFEEAPRPSDLCPDVSPALDALVARLIAKDREKRPADGRALAAEVRAWDRSSRESKAAPVPSSGLTAIERRLVSVILAAEVKDGERWPASVRLHPGLLPRWHDDAHTLDAQLSLPSAYLPLVAALREAAQRYGARLEILRDGSVAAALVGAASPLDLAARGARCALAIRGLLPNAWVALATSWGVVDGTQAVGQVIDRAGTLLDARANVVPPASRPVLLDSMTASLLGARFELRSDGMGPVLLAEREPSDAAHALLGRPIPCVGRDRELRALEDLFDECASEPCAHAAVITGAAGVGKSRLRAELVRRLLGRGQPLEVWLGRGDPQRAGAPLGLLAQMVRRAAEILDGEPLDERRRKLSARIARSVDPLARARVTEFLGEMIGTPFPSGAGSRSTGSDPPDTARGPRSLEPLTTPEPQGADRVELRAARQDPLLMGDQMRRAWVDFLSAECRVQPVILVLEDLHWGDQPSVEYLDAALRLLSDRPLLVVALGRPDLRDLFPALWAERDATEMRLGELPRRACERLVRAALGAEVSDEQVGRIVERSAGNAFFLEELVRAFADGRDEADAPATVLAMLQARLEGLDPDARRALRAASVMGDVFWRGAVVRLIGEVRPPASVDALLAALERRELILRRQESRLRDEAEYRFRHSLVREAAYGMLTDEDRALGHRLAAEWLEEVGESDAMVLAEHYDEGGARDRAAEHYRRAAEQALGANDLLAAQARADRAIACGAAGETLGELHLLRAETLRWRGELAEAEPSALAALTAFPVGSARWCAAATELAGTASRLGREDRLVAVADALAVGWDDATVDGAEVAAMAAVAAALLHLGEHHLAAEPCARVRAAEARFRDDPSVHRAVLRMRAVEAQLAGDLGVARALYAQLAEDQERAGNLRRACHHRVLAAWLCGELGAHEEAIDILRVAQADAERLGIASIEAMAKGHMGVPLALTGAVDEARRLTEEAVAFFFVRGDRRLEAGYRTHLARILRLAGDPQAAALEAHRAAAALAIAPPLRPYALGVLAEALLAGGRRAEALERAAEAAALLGSERLIEQGEALVRLVHAEALEANGDHAAACTAIADARARLLAHAARLPDERWRASFLARVPENARTLDLARAWLGDDPDSAARR